jgi:hypothetical protein
MGSVVQLVSRSGQPEETRLRPRRTRRSWGREKPCRSVHSTVPQTDTGGRVEDTQAFEITIVKELGKIAP